MSAAIMRNPFCSVNPANSFAYWLHSFGEWMADADEAQGVKRLHALDDAEHCLRVMRSHLNAFKA